MFFLLFNAVVALGENKFSYTYLGPTYDASTINNSGWTVGENIQITILTTQQFLSESVYTINLGGWSYRDPWFPSDYDGENILNANDLIYEVITKDGLFTSSLGQGGKVFGILKTNTYGEIYEYNIGFGKGFCSTSNFEVNHHLNSHTKFGASYIGSRSDYRYCNESNGFSLDPQELGVWSTSLYFDDDNDSISNYGDNCPTISNQNQADSDSDTLGDACDSTPNGDTDDDGIDELIDNCPIISNKDQSDIDGDLLGDVCDADMDEDGFANVIENTFGGDETDNSDYATVMAGIEAFSVSDDPLDRAVPAMGGIGLLGLGLSMLGLGAVRLRKK